MRKELLTHRDDIFVIHDFLSPDECRHFIERSEASGYDLAPINSLGGPIIRQDVRNNDRVMIDDWSVAIDLWERLRPHLPEQMGFWAPIGLNERFRFYRYSAGQQFDWHCDGCYERSPHVRSAFTFMIYLNGGCVGGATEFNLRPRGSVKDSDPISRVEPEAGKALFFVHNVLHRGAPVRDGHKYVMRTDVMCRWAGRS